MADDIHLVPLINQMVRWGDRQTRLSPGERIVVLVPLLANPYFGVLAM